MRLLPLPERDLPEPGAARRVPSLSRPRRRDVQPLLPGRPTDQRVFRRRDFEPLQGQTIRSVARDRSPDVPETPARDGDNSRRSSPALHERKARRDEERWNHSDQHRRPAARRRDDQDERAKAEGLPGAPRDSLVPRARVREQRRPDLWLRSEEHTSELQSLTNLV